ncbi:MAG: hypothetical protein GY841_23490 [FCB group bacterium]|nr:hypothetical protein [FCB group bacterium]
MIDLDKLKTDAQGRWPGVFEHFRINVGDGSHQPCPICGGIDRFRYDGEGDGGYICGQCGAGDGFSLIKKVKGWSFGDTVKAVADIVGGVEYTPKKQWTKRDSRIALQDVWNSTKSLTGSDPVSKYLHSREIMLNPDNVRFHPACYDYESRSRYPAMIARVHNTEGKPVSIHRTYLAWNEPRKADIDSPKKLMTGTEKLTGAAIRLLKPGGMFKPDTIGVAEGIETALACASMFFIATWACISTSVLKNFVPPKGIRKVIVFGDNDLNLAGQEAARVLANTLNEKDYIVNVSIPDFPGDWADVLMRKCRGGDV